MKPVQELEELVKDYKETISALERELKDVRAHPVIAEDVQAKQRLLAQLEQERAAKEEAEKGSSHSQPLPSLYHSSHRHAYSVAGSRDRERETARAN